MYFKYVFWFSSGSWSLGKFESYMKKTVMFKSNFGHAPVVKAA